MGKARIHGSNAKISVVANGKEIEVGEVDKFSAKKVDELKKSQPLGDNYVTSHAVHRGWELSFEGGKVDWNLAQVLHAQDQVIGGDVAGRSPYFIVRQTITYFGKDLTETFEYRDVTIYGYELDVPADELTEKFSGFTGKNRALMSPTGQIATAESAANSMIKALGNPDSSAPSISGTVG